MQNTPRLPAASGPLDITEQLADAFLAEGLCVCPDLLPPDLTAGLRAEADQLWADAHFRPGGVGATGDRQLIVEIRSDRIHWWPEQPASLVQRRYHDLLEGLRVAINRRTFMGLFDWEGHYAVYPEGSFYRRHVDVFAKAPTRQITVIAYLNEGWTEADGGALRLYLDPHDLTRFIDVPPQGGTVVIFESARYPHEVLMSHAPRLSLTGWFRVRT